MAHSSIGLPPSSTGEQLHTHTHNVNGINVHNQIMTIGDGDIADRLLTIGDEGEALVRFPEGSMLFDSFGKAKFSQENYVGHYDHFYGPNFFEWYYTHFDGVSTTVTQSAAAGMESSGLAWERLPTQSGIAGNIGTTDGEKIVKRTHIYHPYVSGTGNLIIMTLAVGDSGKENVVRRWGYFDDEDGIYFKLDGTELSFCVRSSVSGTPVETCLTQAQWQVDKLDGTGLSEMIIDVSKDNIYWMDLQYLGAGRVRFGVVSPDGARRVCGYIENANQNSGPYMSTATLPISIEQENVGIPASPSQIKQFLSAVITEGNRPESCSSFSADTSKTLSVASEVPIMSFRPKTTFMGKRNRAIIMPSSLVINTTNTDVIVRVYASPTLTGDTWAIDPNLFSGCEVDTAATGTTGGIKLSTRYVKAGDPLETDYLDNSSVTNTRVMLDGAGGQSLFFTVTVEPVSATETSVFVAGNWREQKC